jgi:hypothetical protein
MQPGAPTSDAILPSSIAQPGVQPADQQAGQPRQ